MLTPASRRIAATSSARPSWRSWLPRMAHTGIDSPRHASASTAACSGSPWVVRSPASRTRSASSWTRAKDSSIRSRLASDACTSPAAAIHTTVPCCTPRADHIGDALSQRRLGTNAPAVGSGGRRVARVKLAGLSRHPGRVASGGEAEANVAWPQPAALEIFALCENERKRGPSAHDLPGAVSSPRCPRAARTPPERSTLAPIDLRAERVGATAAPVEVKPTLIRRGVRSICRVSESDSMAAERRSG